MRQKRTIHDVETMGDELRAFAGICSGCALAVIAWAFVALSVGIMWTVFTEL